jgi:hypothetical protein
VESRPQGDRQLATAAILCIRCNEIFKRLKIVGNRPQVLAGICPACRIGPPRPRIKDARKAATGVEALLNAIRQGIAEEGYYILFGDRMQLIYGPGTPFRDVLTNREAITRFAVVHRWFAQIQELTITFSPMLR